eukprot:g6142.t1
MDQTTVQLYFHNGIVVLTMLIGLLQAFYGQRFKKQTFFTVGAAAAGWGVYSAVQHFGPNQWDLNEVEMTVTSVSAPIIAAVLGGILLVYIEKLALFALGAGLGGYGVYTLTVLAPAISTAAPFGIPFFYAYLAYALVGIAVGTVAVKTERYIVMLATSAIGTVFFFGGISFFTPNPVMKRHIPKYQNDGAKADARPNTKVTKLKVTNGSLLPQISINFPPPRLPSRKPKNVIDPRSPT